MFQNKKILYTILFVSLALNTFIIGVCGYYATKFHTMHADDNWIERRLDHAEERLLRHLEGDDKELARQSMQQRRPELMAAFSQWQQARQAFGDSLSAETPSPQALTQALDQSQMAADRINESVHGLLRQLAQGLSPEARREIGEHMRRHHQHDDD